MEILKVLFEPVVFFSILGASLLLSLIILIALAGQDKKITRLKETVKQETAQKEEFYKQASGLKEEVDKLSGELTIKNKMYEGLVGQYNELERDSDRLAQELEASKKNIPKAQPQAPLQPQRETLPQPNPPQNNTP